MHGRRALSTAGSRALDPDAAGQRVAIASYLFMVQKQAGMHRDAMTNIMPLALKQGLEFIETP